MKLHDLVISVIDDFTNNSVLFTSLDVSNKVKESLPLARHREVSNMVRSLFNSNIVTKGYARTPIDVTLSDGSSVEALLYHPLKDAWDLDLKYQTRSQEPGKPNTIAQIDPSPICMNGTLPINVGSNSLCELWEELLKSDKSVFGK